MNTLIEEKKVMIILKRGSLPAANRVYITVEEVYVRVKNKNKWVRPLIAVNIIDITSTVQWLNDTRREIFKTFQLKPFRRINGGLYKFERRKYNPLLFQTY